MRRRDRNRSGTRIAQARTLRNMTQEALAMHCALRIGEFETEPSWLPSLDIIQSIEDGSRRVTDHMLHLIAVVLDVDPAWLLGHKDGRQPKEKD